MRLPWFGGSSMCSATHPWPIMAWTALWLLFLTACFTPRAGPCLVMGFPFLSPFFAHSAILLPFSALPFCCSCRGIIWPVPLGLYGSVAYSSPNDSMWSLVSNSCHFGLFFAHFIAYGFFCPIYFPWTSSAQFLVLHTNGLSLTPLGFPGPIALFLILGAHGLPTNPLLSYSITLGLLWPILTLLHNAHEFSTFLSGLL